MAPPCSKAIGNSVLDKVHSPSVDFNAFLKRLTEIGSASLD